MVRGAWQAMVHKVAKSQTQLKQLSMDVSQFIVTDLRQTLTIAPQSSSVSLACSLFHTLKVHSILPLVVQTSHSSFPLIFR